jgi:hypothetical protein
MISKIDSDASKSPYLGLKIEGRFAILLPTNVW